MQANRAQRSRLFQNEAKVLRTRTPRTRREHLVHADCLPRSQMSRTQTLPPGSSQTHRLGGRGEGQAHLRANVPAYAGAARAQRTSSLLARADGQQSLPGGSESDYCVCGGGGQGRLHT